MSSKNVKFGGMPSLSASTGGASSGMFSSVRNMIPSLSWKTIGIIILVIILAVIAYLIYKSVSDSAKNPSYKANRENIPVGSAASDSGKEAEIMLFYTDWCPHCKTAKPEWEQVKAEYNGKQIHGYTIIFTEVNCTNESPDVERMMNTYKIDGYPTIKLVKDNQIIDYDAKPSKATLTQFLNTVV
jgi:thiol-disulfide isomerase/thioredoxin